MFLAALSVTTTTWDQNKYVPAQIEIIATRTCSPAHYLSSIVDIIRFY